jgi:hypothetical protein
MTTWPQKLLWLLAIAGCATPKQPVYGELERVRPPPESATDDAVGITRAQGRPFVKLAKRELGLVVGWLGDPPDPGAREQLERELARLLKDTYRAPMVVHSVARALDPIPAEIVLDLASKGVDDVVLLEAEEKNDGAHVEGRVRVLVLGPEVVACDRRVVIERGSRGRPTPERFAERVWTAVTQAWTDPGANAPLDPLAVADRLAERGACREAVSLYATALPAAKPISFHEGQRIARSQEKQKTCARELALAEAVAKDRDATFSLAVDTERAPREIARAFTEALKESPLEKILRKRTTKPVVLEVGETTLVLSMRHHPEAYRTRAEAKQKELGPVRAIVLDPYFDVMRELAALRESAAERLDHPWAASARKLGATLRLVKFPDDHVEIDFADLDDRIILADTLRVKIGGIGEAEVQTTVKRLLREGVFVLGPNEREDGQPTGYALLDRFFSW